MHKPSTNTTRLQTSRLACCREAAGDFACPSTARCSLFYCIVPQNVLKASKKDRHYYPKLYAAGVRSAAKCTLMLKMVRVLAHVQIEAFVL